MEGIGVTMALGLAARTIDFGGRRRACCEVAGFGVWGLGV